MGHRRRMASAIRNDRWIRTKTIDVHNGAKKK